MADFTVIATFLAGLVSFLSPCILPLVPAYLTFLGGTSIKEVNANNPHARAAIFISSVFFVLGFSLVFSIVGVLLQSALSHIAYDLRQWLSWIGGSVIVIFGLMLLGIIKFGFLEKEYKLNLKKVHGQYISSFVFGAAFAVGWTPCVGAVLGGVLTLAATQPAAAFPLMLAYSLGLGVPFIFVGVFFSRSVRLIKIISPHLPLLNKIFGLVLVALGLLVMTNSLSLIANFPFLGGITFG